MDVLNFVYGIFYSFLPKPYWRRWRPSSTVDLVRSAILSGLMEFGVCLYLLVLGFCHFLLIRAQQLQGAADANAGTQMYFTALLAVEYVFHPLSMLGIVLAGEGALRMWAAYFTDEVVPSFLPRLFLLIEERRAAQKKEASFGPDIPDVFENIPGEASELRIYSQRPKDGWRPAITVAVQGELYEIASANNTAGARPFVYILHKLQPGSVIRGNYRYDPPGT
jgi:hypothetical protein